MFDLNDPEVQVAIQKAVDEQVKGLKTKNDELIQKNTGLKDELNGLKQKFDGIDFSAIKELLGKASMDEEAKLIAEGKLDEVIAKRTEKMRQEHEKQLTSETSRADKAEVYANNFKESVVRAQVAQEFVALGGRPEAAEDVANLALSQLKIDDNGKAVAFDDKGEVVIGKDGKTPFGAKDWAESLKENRSFYFIQPQGMGGTGNRSGQEQTNILKADGSVNLTKLGQLKNENPALAKELAAKHGINL